MVRPAFPTLLLTLLGVAATTAVAASAAAAAAAASSAAAASTATTAGSTAAAAPAGAGSVKLFVFPGRCFESLVEQQRFDDIPCIKLVASKSLGLLIVAGSFLLKAPQIAKILAAKDVTGLSPSSFYLEMLGFVATVVYNVLQGNPFSTFGESVVILVQNALLVLLLWTYAERPPSLQQRLQIAVAFVGVGAGMVYLPPHLRLVLPVLSTVATISSRLQQILANFRNGHTGQTSLITWTMNAAGALIRVFTTMQEVGDLMLLASFGLGAATSTTIVAQILMYWHATNAALKLRKAKKQH